MKAKAYLLRIFFPGLITVFLGFGMLLTNALGEVTDLYILNIEVTQGAQCLDKSDGYVNCEDNSIQLTTGKPVGVRVFVGHEGGPVCTGMGPCYKWDELKGATVKMRWIAAHPGENLWDHVPDEKTTTFDIPCTNNSLKDMRGFCGKNGSANFIIPSDRLGNPNKPNLLWVQAEVIAPPQIKDSIPENNIKQVMLGTINAEGIVQTGGLFPRDEFSVTVVPVIYDCGPKETYPECKGPIYPCQTTGDCVTAIAEASSVIKAMFPMPVQYTATPLLLYFYKGPPLSAASGPEKLLKGLSWLKESYLKPEPHSVVGWLPKLGGGGGGMGETPKAPGAAAYVIPGVLGVNNAGSMAHEVGHTFTLNHPNNKEDETRQEACWPFRGDDKIWEPSFNVLSGEVASETQCDFMAQCGDWAISPYMWNRLLFIPYSRNWSSCDPKRMSSASFSFMPGKDNFPGTEAPVLANALPQQAILIGGLVYDDGHAELDPFYQLTSAGPFPVSDPQAPYCLDFQTDTGSTLSSHCFNLTISQPINGSGEVTGGFSSLLPLPTGTRRIALRKGLIILVERAASPNPPYVEILSPLGGENFNGRIPISWTATDADGADLRFAVLYSFDGGSSFFPIGFDLEDTSLEVESSFLAGGDNALIRIMATDGFNTSTADSAIFKVERKAPIVVIQAPQNNTRINPMNDTVFLGHALDLEDGQLEDSRLRWTSDRDGFLGIGSQLVLNGQALSLGMHTITLKATDSDGNEGTASVTVFVVLPVRIDIKPGSEPNIINPKSRGKIPVAILSMKDLDAPKMVDRDSLTFGSTGDEDTLAFCNRRGEDINGDGLKDLVCHFSTEETGFLCGDTEGILKGMTMDGTPIQGRDSVRIIPCEK